MGCNPSHGRHNRSWAKTVKVWRERAHTYDTHFLFALWVEGPKGYPTTPVLPAAKIKKKNFNFFFLIFFKFRKFVEGFQRGISGGQRPLPLENYNFFKIFKTKKFRMLKNAHRGHQTIRKRTKTCFWAVWRSVGVSSWGWRGCPGPGLQLKNP